MSMFKKQLNFKTQIDYDLESLNINELNLPLKNNYNLTELEEEINEPTNIGTLIENENLLNSKKELLNIEEINNG